VTLEDSEFLHLERETKSWVNLCHRDSAVGPEEWFTLLRELPQLRVGTLAPDGEAGSEADGQQVFFGSSQFSSGRYGDGSRLGYQGAQKFGHFV